MAENSGQRDLLADFFVEFRCQLVFDADFKGNVRQNHFSFSERIMTRKLIFGFVLAMALAIPSYSQNDERSMSLSANVIAPILGGADLLYQLKLTNYLALTVPGHFYYLWPVATMLGVIEKGTAEKIKQTKAPILAGGGLGARFLMAQAGLNDTFYLEPRVTLHYGQFGFDTPDGKVESQSFALKPMGLLGWDWYFDSGFYMGLGGSIGFSYLIKNNTTYPDKIEKNNAIKTFLPPENSRFMLAWGLDFRLGFAW